jgi:hypothetical protein
MEDVQAEWEDIEIPANDEQWFVLVLYARIAVSLELLELCEAMNARTGKKRRKVVKNIMRLLEGEDCETIEA